MKPCHVGLADVLNDGEFELGARAADAVGDRSGLDAVDEAFGSRIFEEVIGAQENRDRELPGVPRLLARVQQGGLDLLVGKNDARRSSIAASAVRLPRSDEARYHALGVGTAPVC